MTDIILCLLNEEGGVILNKMCIFRRIVFSITGIPPKLIVVNWSSTTGGSGTVQSFSASLLEIKVVRFVAYRSDRIVSVY